MTDLEPAAIMAEHAFCAACTYNPQGPCLPYSLAAEWEKDRKRVQRVRDLSPSIDGSGGRAHVVAWGDLRAALDEDGAA